jgi:hypothetical protein
MDLVFGHFRTFSGIDPFLTFRLDSGSHKLTRKVLGPISSCRLGVRDFVPQGPIDHVPFRDLAVDLSLEVFEFPAGRATVVPGAPSTEKAFDLYQYPFSFRPSQVIAHANTLGRIARRIELMGRS